MSSFRFLHAADLHLDSPLRGLARRGEAAGAFVEATRRALENLVAKAIELEVAFLIIAGDVYDGDWKDYATGQFFVRQMGRLARANIKVFLIRGNHDAESVITRNLPLPDNVHSFPVGAAESIGLPALGVTLHGRGFGTRHVPENVVLSYPPAASGQFNIGLLHTSLTGREGHDVYAPCTVEDLTRLGYDYWALGHIHQREVVSESPAVVFPGNLQGRHARETGPKGATLVSVENGRIMQMEALALDVARFAHVELDLSGLADIPAFHAAAGRVLAEARAEAEGRPLALRLTLTGRTDLHAHLTAHAEQVHEDMQALAFHAGADVLIEKVRLATSARQQAVQALELAGFEAILDEVAADPAFRADLAATLAILRGKAPVEALGLMEMDAASPEVMADDVLTEARARVAATLGEANAEDAA
ncbi:metallophosphoesterase [Azorhizobium oxalatiphilum]|uniref:Metallophosphoesterase n=1 Tax=Azorhizobium oxalatiphilum TaxID=980631 RepID=A0A917BRZ6_9HYPH|nr:DNA repair exonuclease [Azorhizobium oxalatiphilum]GGF54667.1 metallophosphoesterase [Azorhizobium oxalatiphilum]